MIYRSQTWLVKLFRTIQNWRIGPAGRQARLFAGAETDDDVDPADRRARGRLGHLADQNRIAGNVLEPTVILEGEMMVVVDIRVEIGPPRLDHNFVEQPRRRALLQRIVDGRHRYPHRTFARPP